jgi:rod shape-determining protein MreD
MQHSRLPRLFPDMALLPRRDRFAPPPTAFEQQLIPVVSVMLASLSPLLPVIATAPAMPPLGFMMLLCWRLMRNDLWPVWAALPLGAFDDLFSGAPIGTAMALWTMTFVAIDAIDRRFVWRDHYQDWGIAIAFVAAYLTLALWLSGGALPMVLLLPQIGIATLLFPGVTRVIAMLDRWRLGR